MIQDWSSVNEQLQALQDSVIALGVDVRQIRSHIKQIESDIHEIRSIQEGHDFGDGHVVE